MDLYASHVIYDYEHTHSEIITDNLVYKYHFLLFMRSENIRLKKEREKHLKVHEIKRQLMAMGPLNVVMADPELRKIAISLYEQIKDYVNGF